MSRWVSTPPVTIPSVDAIVVMSVLHVPVLGGHGATGGRTGQGWPVAAGSYEVTSTSRPYQSVLPPGRRITFRATRAAGLYQGQTERENPLIQHPCLYLVTRSLDPKGTGQARWTMRWKPALNAFATTFADRWPAAETSNEDRQKHRSRYRPRQSRRGVMSAIVRCVISPGLGIARVGNSPAEYYVGPEAPGQLPQPPGGFKDPAGRIKR